MRTPKWVELSGQSLLDIVPDPVLIANWAGEIAAANLQAETLFGYSRKELIGRTVERVIPPRLMVQHAQQRKNLFRDQRARSVNFQSFALCKDSTEVPVEISLSRFTNEAGSFVVSAYRDSTARYHTEGLKILAAVLHETRESEERFSLLADAAPALIWMSGPDKLCTYVNQARLDLTGRSMDSELGNGWTEAVHPEDLRNRDHTYEKAFDRREEFRQEYRLRRQDGEYRWILDVGVPRFDQDQSFVGYVGIGADVTDRKRAEAALASVSGKLIEAQERERTRIARELHDDFSQRLAILGIGLEELKRTLPESDLVYRTKVQEMFDKTRELSSDMHSLSHQLHSSRLEHVGLVCALSGLCKEIGEKYKIEVQFTARDFPLEIPKDVALCLFRLAQEALSNVVKHSRAKTARVELFANASGVSLRIRDDGRGFDTERTGSGPGIGLIGMHERIRLVGGKLLVKSGPAQGTDIVGAVPLRSCVPGRNAGY
ncbi:MAG TPA: PAS domain S-box protein [Candidatus Acidoferrum sp.]|nr:PAS domain S-box protein [Candidatus Acidoferrum sp.]